MCCIVIVCQGLEVCNAGPTSGRVRLLHIPSQTEADGC